ncbi:SRPBCC family protein [Mycobacterium sp. RTGN3]|uniref:SRPBCC family protein n=1 Tax=Mycobacterium sp. RTGN3 TaxID=3016524 RepID=UPI0029C8E147|nr:SRPBCC family protein [Mycobacterium sp. RTGN3]
MDIARAPADVFEYLKTPANIQQWMTSVTSISDVSGDGGVGSTYTQVVSAAGREVTTTVEVVEVEPVNKLKTVATGGGVKLETLLELTGGGDTTSVVMTLNPGPLGAMMKPVFKSQGQASLEQLKSLLEA